MASAHLGPVHSNAPLRPEWTVTPETEGHVLLDLGGDEYTVGRPHPMLDPAARLAALARAVDDPRVSVVLLDVVLGHGSHPDPASILAPAIESAVRRPTPLSIVVSLVGTADDPQGLTRQAQALSAAGALVYLSNAEAARYAASLIAPATETGSGAGTASQAALTVLGSGANGGPATQPLLSGLLGGPPEVVTVGASRPAPPASPGPSVLRPERRRPR